MTTIKHPGEDVAWYALSAEDVAGQMGVDPDRGLDADEVTRRLAEYGPTSCRPSRRRACGWSGGASWRTR